MAATTPALDLPLFPLSNVLFPGGHLQLRIFEPRYIDLVRECARTGRAFGVCMILEGREAGQPAVPAAAPHGPDGVNHPARGEVARAP